MIYPPYEIKLKLEVQPSVICFNCFVCSVISRFLEVFHILITFELVILLRPLVIIFRKNTNAIAWFIATRSLSTVYHDQQCLMSSKFMAKQFYLNDSSDRFRIFKGKVKTFKTRHKNYWFWRCANSKLNNLTVRKHLC